MADGTAIEWTHRPGTKGETLNPTTGCDRISPGCTNCYALTMAARLKGMGSAKYQNDGDPETSGPGFGLTVHPEVLDQIARWGKPRTVFLNSMSDLWHDQVPDAFLEKTFDAMRDGPQHTFQVLTKRSHRMRRWVNAYYDCDHGGSLSASCSYCEPFPNVWLGVSVESDRYTFRARHLADTPAAVRFLSCEPLLGPLPSLDLSGIDWVIVGGESGPHARPLELEWIDEIAEKTVAAGSRLFVKQLGTAWSLANGHGRTHGGDWDLWPERLRVRQWPTLADVAA